MSTAQFDYHHVGYNGNKGFILHAGRRPDVRVVPPAGEAHAFVRKTWARNVEVWVSPTGRSVRVWVDGEEVKP